MKEWSILGYYPEQFFSPSGCHLASTKVGGYVFRCVESVHKWIVEELWAFLIFAYETPTLALGPTLLAFKRLRVKVRTLQMQVGTRRGVALRL